MKQKDKEYLERHRLIHSIMRASLKTDVFKRLLFNAHFKIVVSQMFKAAYTEH